MCIYLKADDEKYGAIIQNIKEKYLSKSFMPKLILGTGLSVTYKIPGMNALYEQLSKEFNKCSNSDIVTMWNTKKDDIEKNGLEAGLGLITPLEEPLVEMIKKITAKYILEEENRLFDEIYNSDTGFKRLLVYLKDTCSVNSRILDIMTPNYDRIVEIVCDSLKINVITGFEGQNICRFNSHILKKPQDTYNTRKKFWVRLFKPHGSLNWLKVNGDTILSNDNMRLYNNSDDIEIITPGSSKYKAGMINPTYRSMREDFNELLDEDNSYSLFIFGYGFNDQHFDNVLYDYFNHNTLIVSKYIKTSVIDKALKNTKLTLFYEDDNKNYMIYKGLKYEIEDKMWDINIFASVIIG